MSDSRSSLRPAPHLRKKILKNRIANLVLKAIETKNKSKIQFYTHNDISYWGEVDGCDAIVLDRREKSYLKKVINGADWPNRLLYHELAHAFLDSFIDQTDYSSFMKIFGKYSCYTDDSFEIAMNIIKGNLNGTASVTRYGKSHAQESFAESFSFVIANVDDSDEEPEVIKQLSYVDWMVENIRLKKRNWGKFKGYTTLVTCAHCELEFQLEGCRLSKNIRNWEIECPKCLETVIGN